MPQQLESKSVDVLVIGGGSAGVTAALAAKQRGSDVLLVEAGSHLGGNLITGIPLLGCVNARGEWIIGGVMEEFLKGCDKLDGYPGVACDYRLTNAVCADPDAMKIAVQETLADHGIPLLLYTYAEDVVMDGNSLEGVVAVNKNGRTLIEADVIIDCSGDGDVAICGGAEHEKGSASSKKELQPVSLIYQMNNVDFDRYLEFVRDNPNEFILAENSVYPENSEECAQQVYKDGVPFFTAQHAEHEDTILKQAIDDGEMFPTTAFYMATTNSHTQEVGVNVTRVPEIDATETGQLSEALSTLSQQVKMSTSFLQDYIPGFEAANLSGVSPRIGIRETRRIVGEYMLTKEDVLEGRTFDDGIAKGSHHIDIHGGGTHQERLPVSDGGSYDIPYDCLVPKKLDNVLVAGRHISSDRDANGSARMLGQCMATGQAAAIAASMCVENNWSDVRDVSVDDLRSELKDLGAVLEGTH